MEKLELNQKRWDYSYPKQIKGDWYFYIPSIEEIKDQLRLEKEMIKQSFGFIYGEIQSSMIGPYWSKYERLIIDKKVSDSMPDEAFLVPIQIKKESKNEKQTSQN